MSDSTLKEELERLRAQVEAISTTVEAQQRDRKHDGISSTVERARELAENIELPELSDRLGAFFKDLGTDMKDSKPGALAASFAAGVLVGKILSR